MNIIIMGPPGAGKGTIAKAIEQKFNLPHLSTGDLLREAVFNKKPDALKSKTYLDHGQLVPDDIAISILKKKFSEKDCLNGFILDGFPRTINQAKILDSEKIKIDKVINLDVGDGTLISRIVDRRTCRSCQAVYNIKTIPSKKPGICDICGGKLYQREDQKPEIVKERLIIYKNQTEPLIEYYKKKGILITVDASKKPELVQSIVVNKLRK